MIRSARIYQRTRTAAAASRRSLRKRGRDAGQKEGVGGIKPERGVGGNIVIYVWKNEREEKQRRDEKVA